MLQIRDVMTRHVFTVTPETTLRETADLFARHHISGAPVLAGHHVVGVVSATDLMTRNVCSLGPDADIGEAAQYMWQAGIHRLLVLDQGELSGILSMSDVARILATSS